MIGHGETRRALLLYYFTALPVLAAEIFWEEVSSERIPTNLAEHGMQRGVRHTPASKHGVHLAAS